jgi:hypothetical protein
MIDMGGSSQDVRGGRNLMTLYFDAETNMENIKFIGAHDYVAVAVEDETNATHKFSTGRKMVRTVYVLDGSQVLGGADNPDFAGGFGQGTNPSNYRGLATQTAGGTGMPVGGQQQGDVTTGIISSVGATTGAAPCWQCAPQPDTINARTSKTIATDYGSDRNNFNKGTTQ